MKSKCYHNSTVGNMFVGDRWIGFCLDCKTVYDIETGKPAEKEDKEEWIKNHIQEAEVYQLNA